MALQDVADSLVAQLVADIGQSASDAVVAPVAVVAGDLDDQRLNRAIERVTVLARQGELRRSGSTKTG